VIDTMDCPEARISLGVYVLGALEPEDRAAIDAHLMTCDGCRAELADLESLPMLLAVLSTEDAATLADGLPQEPATPLVRADSRRAPGAADRPADLSADRVRRRNRRGAWLSAAAVAAIALAAVSGAQLGTRAGRADAAPYAGPALGSWQSVQGSNAVDMRATVRYRRMGWGTQLAVQVTGIPLNTPCAIEAFERNGTTVVGGSWITDSNEGKVWYIGSAAISKDTVTKFVITVAGHPATAITIPA
jgi:anti-sigma factor RsiW